MVTTKNAPNGFTFSELIQTFPTTSEVMTDDRLRFAALIAGRPTRVHIRRIPKIQASIEQGVEQFGGGGFRPFSPAH
jgi:hypothetical protein